MVKGCKKNVVYLKNTGSEMFEEAYFIISEAGKRKNQTENDMVCEANKIVNSSPVSAYFLGAKKTRESARAVNRVVWFMAGACVMTALNAVIFLLI